jgi:hypothetical protein
MARISSAGCASEVSHGEAVASPVRLVGSIQPGFSTRDGRSGPADRGIPRNAGSTTMVRVHVQGNGTRSRGIVACIGGSSAEWSSRRVTMTAVQLDINGIPAINGALTDMFRALNVVLM